MDMFASIEAYENGREEREAASNFLDGLRLAEKYSLGVEYMVQVFREIRGGRSTKEAIDLALGEWDIA